MHSTHLGVLTPFLCPPAAHVSLHAVSRRENHAGNGLPAMGPMLPRVLDHLDYGVMLVDPAAYVHFANRIAQRDCGGARGLRLVDGQLRARHERDQQRLLRALVASQGGRRSLLAVVSQDGPCMLAILPLEERHASVSAEPTALVVLGRSQVCEPLTVDFFAREHGLTAAETSVLRHLVDGRRPADIVRHTGVAMSTVRTQIKSIRQKTGAPSIGELVRLVTVLPPIVPVLGS
jgi:DNA-binding CsgD family transcriptional regulator